MRSLRLPVLFALLPFAYVVACVGDDPVTSNPPTSDGGASSSSSSSGGSSSGGSDGGGDAPSSSTIDGVVVDSVGSPVLDATVRVEGSTKTAKTDAKGAFTLDAPATYDLTVVYPTAATTTGLGVLAFGGLTSRQPRVQVVSSARHKATSTTVTATGAAGGALPTDGVYSFLFAPAPTVRVDPVVKSVFGATTVFTGPTALGWTGDATFAGTIHGFRYTNDAAEMPVDFQGYGTQSFTIGEASTTSFSVDFGAIAGADPRISGAVDYAGATASAFTYQVRVKGTTAIRFPGRNFRPTTFDLPFPNNVTMRGAVFAAGTRGAATAGAWKTNLTGGTAGVALTIPAEMIVKDPAVNAVDVDDSTTFGWDPAPAPFDAYQLAIACKGAASEIEHQVVVLTKKTSLKIPAAGALGAPMPSAKTCTWTVVAFKTASMDDTVGPAGWGRFLAMEESLEDGAFSTSSPRSFTSK